VREQLDACRGRGNELCVVDPDNAGDVRLVTSMYLAISATLETILRAAPSRNDGFEVCRARWGTHPHEAGVERRGQCRHDGRWLLRRSVLGGVIGARGWY
jgi:hypothetical protein